MNKSIATDISKRIESILSDKLFNDVDEIETNNSSVDHDRKNRHY